MGYQIYKTADDLGWEGNAEAGSPISNINLAFKNFEWWMKIRPQWKFEIKEENE